MSGIKDPSDGLAEQDRTLTDLLETWRHKQNDPSIPDERKRAASQRMETVWADLAKLSDPDGLITHISNKIQTAYQRRQNPEDVDKPREKPLCKCSRPRHVCEVKQGLVPAKLQTRDLTYIKTQSSRVLAREYVQTHTGDVIVRESMSEYRSLRSDIYSELSDILAMLDGTAPMDTASTQDAADGRTADADSGADDSPTAITEPADTATERRGSDMRD